MVLSPLLVFIPYALIDAVAQPTLGQLEPGWFEAEAGILVTGIVWLLVGLTCFAMTREKSTEHTSRTGAP